MTSQQPILYAITLNQFFDFVKASNSEHFADMLTWTYSTKKYMTVFNKHGHKAFFLSWNWSAFLFNFYWLLYRKLYRPIIFSILLSVIVIIAVVFIQAYPSWVPPQWLGLIIMTMIGIGTIFYLIGFGALANWYYVSRAKKLIVEGNNVKGGVSYTGLVILIILKLLSSISDMTDRHNSHSHQSKAIQKS